MENAELVRTLNDELLSNIPEQISYDALHTALSEYLNELIKHDFERLIAYLYRIDVNEQKLKSLLQKTPGEDAGNIIATLILERQLQKIKSRQQTGQQDKDIDEEEKW